MQKIIFLFLFVFTNIITSQAQQPVIKVNDKDSGKVVLNSLKIDVKVVANIATTTMEMEFCNNSNRILEGELTFPMPEGVSISRYVIDINGTMREAVPVEKEKGQVVFENIVKRRVDPGLLEKVEGNNFRTRIYPLPANGCRKVIIAYQEPLTANNTNELTYNLPLQFRKAINKFSFEMNVYSNLQPEIGKACGTALKFAESKNVFTAKVNEENFQPNGAYQISIPQLAQASALIQKIGTNYFFLVNHFPQYKAIEKKMPSTVHIVWDNSFSGLNRDHKKEINFIKAYAAQIKKGTIILSTIGYNFQTIGNYTISNGTCNELATTLEKIIYDGATNLSLLQWNVQADEHLLFSDGLNTYGNFLQVQFPTQSLHTITASPTANFTNLKFMADKTGGQFINLNTLTVPNAIKNLSQQQLRLINVSTESTVSEVYPSFAVVKGNMAITGISTTPNTKVVLQYGYGNTVSYNETVELKYEEQQTTDIALDKIWAQQKIAQLEVQYDIFKKQITDLGKQYNIVTRNTSLIVLDDVADYAKYEIEPPADLKPAYDSLILAKRNAEKEKLENTLSNAKNMMDQLKAWWTKDFSPNAKGVVYGQTDKMKGVMVIAGTQTTTTDADGNFEIKNFKGTKLTFKKAGYITQTITIDAEDDSESLEVYLEPVVVNKGKRGEELYIKSKKIKLERNQGMVMMDSVARGVSETYDYSISASAPSPTELMDRERLEVARGEVSGSGFFSSTLVSSNAMQDVVVTTVNQKKNNFDKSKATIDIKEISSNKPFIKTLKETAIAQRYEKYLELRKAFLHTPSFYFEVAKFFFQQNEKATGLKILSNVADLNLEDHELYKMLGYQLKIQGEYTEEVNVFKKVLDWRPQEPQSYRDYGLALADAGKYQNAIDTMYSALTRNYDGELMTSYQGIEEIITTEINNIIDLQKAVNASKIDAALKQSLPVDVRVVLNWNMADTDIDLWVIDPRDEKCFYSHQLTKIGGRISKDFTQGYGPEQFMLKNAVRGKYKVMLHYYGDRVQKIAGGSTVMAEIYTNYGKPDQQRKLIALQMDKGEDKEGILVGEFVF
jgi:tetratricopeptide (TPR) repeat protein